MFSDFLSITQMNARKEVENRVTQQIQSHDSEHRARAAKHAQRKKRRKLRAEQHALRVLALVGGGRYPTK